MKNYYDRTWKIGELARMFDINVQLLRHYDSEIRIIIGAPINMTRFIRWE